MAEGMARLEVIAARGELTAADDALRLEVICAVVALDYLRLRFDGQPGMPPLPALEALSPSGRQRAFAHTVPC